MAKNTRKNALQCNVDAKKRYAKKTLKPFGFHCNQITEQNIIDKLESVENKAGYIKELIRKDMEKTNKKT